MESIDYGLFEGNRGEICFNPTQFIMTFLIEEGKYLVKDAATKQFYEYAEDLGIYIVVDIDEIKRDLMGYFNSIVPKGWSVGYEKQYIPALNNLVPIIYDFDKRINTLVFLNCCYQIKTKKVLNHSPKWHRTVMIPYNYDRGAKCPLFDQYLKDVTCNDRLLEDTLEEVLGYMLYPLNSANKMIVFLGEGANSKSTFMTLMKNMAGKSNTSAVPLKDFEKSFTRHSLKGKLLNLVPEGEFLKVDTLMSGIVKQFITGDEVSAEIKGGETYTFEPNLKIAIALNRLPDNIKDTTPAIKRRLLILPFKADFTGKRLDRNMSKKLMAEMPGIINRALNGLERLEKNSFVFSYEEQSAAVIDDLFMSSDPLYYFVAKYIVHRVGAKLGYGSALKMYNSWCVENNIDSAYGARAFSSKFKDKLRSKNFRIVSYKSNGKTGLEDIACIYRG